MNRNEIKSTIIEAIRESQNASRALQRASERIQGVYGQFTALAATVPVRDFETSLDEVFEAIRSNADGIAVKLKCKKSKKGDSYQVPGSARTAKSVLLGAIKYGVPLMDDGSVRPFGQIREDLRSAQEAERLAERSDAEVARDNAIAALRALAERIAGEKEIDEPTAAWLASLAESAQESIADFNALVGEEPAADVEERDAA